MTKRITDLFLVVATAPLWIPLILAIGFAVLIFLGRPILFRQTRAGRGGKPFRIIKFRTMRDSRDANGELQEDSRRLTPFGQWLRSTSLDELPELLLILAGHMSLVGPRPLLMEYNLRYSAEQAVRLTIPPGLTGWAQINGRNTSSWEERFAQDVWYVKNRSWWLDLRILAQTVSLVFKRDGINAPGHTTMPEFKPTLSDGHRPKS